MQAVALLILSNLPGENRLKNLKYFLGQGDNVVGCDPRCQIVLPQQYEMLHHAVNIRVGFNFVTVQSFHPHLIYVQGNLVRSQKEQNDNFFPLACGVQYLPKIGEFFYIGRIKAVICQNNKAQLTGLKHIINRGLFRMSQNVNQMKINEQISEDKKAHSQPASNSLKSREMQFQQLKRIQCQQFFNNITLETDNFNPMQLQRVQIEEKQNIINDCDYKVEVISNIPKIQKISEIQKQDQIQSQEEKSHTQVLDHEQYQATLVLEDGIFQNEPTINLDEQLPYKINPPFSQEQLMSQIRKKSEQSKSQQPQQEQIDYSMPDTIVDQPVESSPRAIKQVKGQNKMNDFEIQQVQSKDQQPNQQQDDQMPPTIQQDEHIQSIIKIKPSKTMKTLVNSKIQDRDRLYRSDKLPKDYSNVSEDDEKPIQDFNDLFEAIQQVPLKHHQSEPYKIEQNSLMNLSPANNENLHHQSLPDILQQKQNSLKKIQQKSDEKSKIKRQQTQHIIKVHIVGFKPTEAHRNFLKKQNLQLVNNPHSDYDLLLVKEPLRLSNRLLMALLLNKSIQSEQWIFNKTSMIQSKLNGIPWKQIYQKKGNHGEPLRGKGRFYISKRLEELLQGVVQKLGGQLVDELTDKRRVLNVVLRVEDSQDTETYLMHKDNKKWRFLKSQILIDCVLTGKYSLDQKYIINIFKQ